MIMTVEEMVREVGERLGDPKRIREVLQGMTVQGPLKHNPYLWDPLSLPGGAVGLCLLMGALDRFFPDEGWDVRGHSFLVEIQEAMLESGGARDLSLSGRGGLCGIGLGVRALSREGTRYQQLQAGVREALLQALPSYIEEARKRLTSGVWAKDYDVIQGAAGTGRYLLLHIEDDDEVRGALERVLSYLVELSKEKEVENERVPGWHVPVEHLILEIDRELFPQGNFNAGVAHGIPGPLALLALSLQKGVEVSGQRAAIRRMVEWLLAVAVRDEYGMIWPERISWEEQVRGKVEVRGDRGAWCYGTPGVARVLWLAGEAIGETEWKELALQAFRGVFRRSDLSRTPAPTICHGLAGLLRIAQRMYADSGDAELKQVVEMLSDRVMSAYDPELPFGFAELYQVRGTNTYEQLHTPGWLDGAAGTALVLLESLRQERLILDWDAALLIV